MPTTSTARTRKKPRVGRRPKPPPSPEPHTSVGDIALFRIDPKQVAPFLLLDVAPDGLASGILFVDPVRDGGAEYVRRHFFTRPTQEMPYRFIHSAASGKAVGQWRTR